MKTKIIIGLGFIVGTVSVIAAIIMKSNRNKESNSSSVDNYISNENEIDVQSVEKSAVNSINETHIEAAKIIKNSVDAIVDNIKTDNNAEEINCVSNELDNLLSEE